MKFLKQLLLILFLYSSFSSCKNSKVKENSNQNTTIKSDGSSPIFKFNKEAHDFGKLKEGEVVEFTFVFTNIGGSPLLINSVEASCGCTTTHFTKEPVLPGNKGKIKITFNSSGFMNNQHKSIRVSANTAEKVKELYFGAFVESERALYYNK